MTGPRATSMAIPPVPTFAADRPNVRTVPRWHRLAYLMLPRIEPRS